MEALARSFKPKTQSQPMGAFLNDLAMLRLDQGATEKSIGLRPEIHPGLEEAALGRHPSLVVPFNNLATTYMKVGRFDEANLTYQRAIICRKNTWVKTISTITVAGEQPVALRKLGPETQ